MNLSRLPSNGPVLSVVIPVFNEKPVLPRLYERLHKALDSLDFQYEIVFVDDWTKPVGVGRWERSPTAQPRLRRSPFAGK